MTVKPKHVISRLRVRTRYEIMWYYAVEIEVFVTKAKNGARKVLLDDHRFWPENGTFWFLRIKTFSNTATLYWNISPPQFTGIFQLGNFLPLHRCYCGIAIVIACSSDTILQRFIIFSFFYLCSCAVLPY